MRAEPWPVGVTLAADIEDRKGQADGYRARVRWTDPDTHRRRSLSQACRTVAEAETWITELRQLALGDATHWDEVVTALGYGYLRRHDLRHTGLTWMADAGVPVHVLRKIAGHGSLATTQRYLHPDHRAISDADVALSAYLNAG
jgi:integrase